MDLDLGPIYEPYFWSIIFSGEKYIFGQYTYLFEGVFVSYHHVQWLYEPPNV